MEDERCMHRAENKNGCGHQAFGHTLYFDPVLVPNGSIPVRFRLYGCGLNHVVPSAPPTAMARLHGKKLLAVRKRVIRRMKKTTHKLPSAGEVSSNWKALKQV